MDELIFETLQDHWYKKDVSLSWAGVHLQLAVAQELFSSHSVDSGSVFLLRSLDLTAMADDGVCVDFGCGYGVLGLAFKAVRPKWEVTLIDRDALAVEFSVWNATRLDLDVSCRGGLGVDGFDRPLDLVLWNVPGKAGAGVLRALTNRILDLLAPGGLLALVVVHPLANELREVAIERLDIELTCQDASSEHTVLHMKRLAGDPAMPSGDAFADGVFNREPAEVDTGLIVYSLLPVVGLPQYDGPDIASVLLMDAIESSMAKDVARVLCVSPGQGHLPIYIGKKWPDCEICLSDRDLLALRASARAIGNHGSVVSRFGTADVLSDEVHRFNLVSAMLPHQIRPPVMERWLERFIESTLSGGHIAVAGGSTEVSRFLALARKRPDLKMRDRDKRKGFSAAIFERR